TKVTDALGQNTQYTYDEVGNRISQIDASGRTTTYEYDRTGRRTRWTLPLGMTEMDTYDDAGNLISKTDFNGKTTTFVYDGMDRLTRKAPDPSLGQPAVLFTYTVTGKRATMQDASGLTTYTYDDRDFLKTKSTPQGALTYASDAAGNVLSVR